MSKDPTRSRHTTVVLVRPQGPVNVGLVCRACANLGISDLRVVNPVCSRHHTESRRFAKHAHEVLEGIREFGSVAEAVADCDLAIAASAHRRARGAIPNLGISALPSLVAARGARRCALVFGPEADGLHNDDLQACQACVQLEAPGSTVSYNLSHAVVLVLHGMITAAVQPAPPVSAPASPQALGALCEQWLATLERFGYFRRTDKRRYAPKLKQLVDRLQPSAQDVNTLRGMFSHLDRHGSKAGSE